MSGNATTATTATNVTATSNDTTNETVYLTFVDGATGTQGIETDIGLLYNPAYGRISTVNLDVDSADIGNVNISGTTIAGSSATTLRSSASGKDVVLSNGTTPTVVSKGRKILKSKKKQTKANTLYKDFDYLVSSDSKGVSVEWVFGKAKDYWQFVDQGVSGAGKNPKTEKEKARRKSFKARHAKNIAKGKCSAAYWANKVKW